MTTTKTQTETFAETTLRNAERGTTIYTVLRHVSSSGMMRVIDAFVIVNNEPVSLRGALVASGYKMHPKHDGVKITGAGMDMGYYLVHNLGMHFQGDGYYFTHRWL